jgi:hypothetical protein
MSGILSPVKLDLINVQPFSFASKQVGDNRGDMVVAIGAYNRSHLYGHRKLDRSYKVLMLDDVIGTPWVWDRCFESEKYRMLENFILHQKRLNAPIRAIGIGSCYPLTMDPDNISLCPHTVNVWRQFEYIECRDVLAYNLFKKAGLDRVHLRRCPSVFFFSEKEKETIRFLPFKRNRYLFINSGDFTKDSKAMPNYVPPMSDYLEYGNSAKDYIAPPRLKRYIANIGRYRTIISKRVHAIMPLIDLGLNLYIIPLDSRYLTCCLTGKINVTGWDEANPFIKKWKALEETTISR